MSKVSSLVNLIVGAIVVLALIVGAIFILPWRQIKWGTISFDQPRTITVTGYSENQVRNQVARFTAGVSAVNDSRDTAIGDVNRKVASIIDAVKKFGVNSDDVKTQNLSVYQGEEVYYDNGQQKSRLGQWRVNNTIEVTLRDIAKAGELADILTKNGATNVYGPNFTLDTSKDNADNQWEAAVKDAQTRAEKMAAASGAKLGKVVSITQGGDGRVIYPMMLESKGGMGGGGAAPVEPGSTTISKTVTVIYTLE